MVNFLRESNRFEFSVFLQLDYLRYWVCPTIYPYLEVGEKYSNVIRKGIREE